MNKRCIVSVATGEFYCKNLDRLELSFSKCVNGTYYFDEWGGGRNVDADYYPERPDLLIWKDVLPPGSRPHLESPYGFKVHAIKEAYEKGYTSILWLDSAAYAVKEDVSPIFEKIEKEGYYAMSHEDPLENWVGFNALRYSNLTPHDLLGLNLPSGSCYGFDLSNTDIKDLFSEFSKSESDGMFKSEPISEGKWHRHDETLLALILKSYGYPIFTFDPLFQSDSPECVIKSGGWL